MKTGLLDKPKYRNQLVNCKKCNAEVLRKHLNKHSRDAHPAPIPIILNSKSCAKSATHGACFDCGVQNKQTWIFEKTSRGTVSLCQPCKQRHLKNSFSQEAMEKKRKNNLRASLNELKELQRKHADDSFHPNIIREISDLKALIDAPSPPPKKWSPILSGSYGTGKRR